MSHEEETDGRRRLEQAVARVAKALEAVAGAVEKGAHELRSYDVPRTFNHLDALLRVARQRAELGYQIGRTANGFSLDDELSDTPAVDPAPGKPEPERIAGQRKKPAAPPDDGVDFIDDTSDF